MSRNNPTKKWIELQKPIKKNHEELLEFEAARNFRQNELRKKIEKLPKSRRTKRNKLRVQQA